MTQTDGTTIPDIMGESSESLSSLGKKLLPWRVYVTLLAACAISLAAGQPYIAALSGLPLSSMILWINAAINMAISIPAILLGLLAARSLGLGVPVLESLLYREPLPQGTGRTLGLITPLSGLAVGIALVAMDLLFIRLIPEGFAALESGAQGLSSLHPLTALAATLYGGIYEELQLRLFVLSGLAWLYTLILRKIQRRPFSPSSRVTTVAVVFAALVFGLAHLPALQALQAASGAMIARTIILNILPGLLFGFLYVRKGLEAAMISHLCADLVMHVVFPALEGRFA
jgi:hypothetical protein